jgi:hypothetical protein
VVSAIARYGSSLLLPVGPPEKDSLHGLVLGACLKWLHKQNGTCLFFFVVPGILRVSGMNYAFKLTQNVLATSIGSLSY